MNKEFNIDEITNMIAQEIREKGLNEVLNLDSIKERVLQKINQPQQEMQTPNLAQDPTQFPQPEEDENQTVAVNEPTEVEKTSFVPGEEKPLDVPIEPPVYKAPLPDMLKNVEPAQIIVFDMNELSAGGENLAAKPFRTMSDPEIKKSMRDYWAEEGKTKADVYVAKFEKLGELDFDYTNGTARFLEKRFDPDFEAQQAYKQNPYQVDPSPKTVENAVDLQTAVKDAAIELLKQAVLSGGANVPSQGNVQESDNTKQEAIKEEKAKITRKDITKIDGDFRKIDTPNELLETINGNGSKAKLVFENEEISTWRLEENEYYFLANPITYKRCYVKK